MRCLIIAGSPEYDAELIRAQAKLHDLVICADRGYSHAKAAGIAPDIVIGDFDSYTDEVDCPEIIRLNTDKDFTDTLISADKAIEKGCDQITVLSATGGRLDHTLANIFLLEYISKKGVAGALLSNKERIELLGRGEHLFSGYDGMTFSLFPLGCESVSLSVRGARWELDNYRLKSSVPIGVSNVFKDGECSIRVTDGTAVIIINLSDEYL